MAVFELAQLKMIRMIIDDQSDVKNVFEPADWLKDPRLSGAGIHTWELSLLSVLIEPIQKPPLVDFNCMYFFLLWMCRSVFNLLFLPGILVT